MPAMYRLIILGLVVGATLVLSGCDQQANQSKSSGESVIVRDNMGRIIRKHENDFITTYEYPHHGDRRIPTSSKTVRK